MLYISGETGRVILPGASSPETMSDLQSPARKVVASRSPEIPGAGTLHKAVAVLDLVASAGAPVRISDLLEKTGMPLGTLHRLLSALVAERLLKQDPRTKAYALGSRIVDLAHSAGDSADIPRLVGPAIDQLAARTGESVAVALVEGDQIVYRAKRDGSGVLRISVKVGDRVPLHAASVGKAVLAYMDPDQLSRAMRGTPLTPHTSRTIGDWEHLGRDLAGVRRRGYALEDEEYVAGVRSVAAPILDRRGYAIGALTVIGPKVNLDDATIDSWSGRLIEAAQDVAVLLGSDMPSQRLAAPDPGTVPTTLELRLRVPAFLGSSPLWDARSSMLYWIDVLAPSLSRFDPGTSGNEVFPMEDLVGGVGLHADPGKLVVALRTEVAEFDLGTRRLRKLASAPADHGEHRFNKGSCDAAGRFWTSSMHMGGLPGAGCLFCLDPDRGLHIADTGLTLPNALAFSPDGATLYLTDSAARTIFAYDLDLAAGEVGPRRALIKIPPQLGRPAGLAVDREGCLWSTHSDGWRITRYAPTGEVLSFITLPVPSANGCGFGDADLGTLYIATARDRLSPRRLANAPLAGSLFSYRTATRGLPPGRFGAAA